LEAQPEDTIIKDALQHSYAWAYLASSRALIHYSRSKSTSILGWALYKK
jgi:hypothetical protein